MPTVVDPRAEELDQRPSPAARKSATERTGRKKKYLDSPDWEQNQLRLTGSNLGLFTNPPTREEINPSPDMFPARSQSSLAQGKYDMRRTATREGRREDVGIAVCAPSPGRGGRGTGGGGERERAAGPGRSGPL